MNNKIKNILLTKDMSPSRFADEIGVQRSSISHILSGRNKPSLEVIQKIVRRFPELGMDWIMDEDEDDETADLNETATSKQATTASDNASSGKATSNIGTTPKELVEDIEINAKRRVEKILIFYSDKTFTEYKPE